MISIGILGGSGYTALELIKILLRHPQVRIVAVTSRQEGTPRVDQVHPSLGRRLDLRMQAVGGIDRQARQVEGLQHAERHQRADALAVRADLVQVVVAIPHVDRLDPSRTGARRDRRG